MNMITVNKLTVLFNNLKSAMIVLTAFLLTLEIAGYINLGWIFILLLPITIPVTIFFALILIYVFTVSFFLFIKIIGEAMKGAARSYDRRTKSNKGE